jgi:ABC-2 type transport system permease protein
MRRVWTLFKAAARVNLQIDMAYRGDAIFGLGMAVFWVVYELATVWIVFSNTDSIGGWGVGEVIALTGVWKIMNTFMFLWIWPNTEKFNEGVRNGTLDYLFLQPVNSQLMVSLNRFVLWRFLELVLSAGMVAGGVALSASLATPSSVAAFLILTMSGVSIIYSLWIILISLTFWFTKFDNNVTILGALMDAGRFPATVYPAWLRALITFVVPIAIATTIPLQALRGELGPGQIGLFLLVGVGLFWAATRVWALGTRRYSGASS